MHTFPKPTGFKRYWVLPIFWIGIAFLITGITSSASAQSTSPTQTIKTLNDLAPFIADIPGLDSLPISSVKTAGDVTSAMMTIKNVVIEVYGFKIGDAKQVALIPHSFTFDKFIPGVADDVLSKIALTNEVFILNRPGRDPVEINTSDLPPRVSDVIDEGSEKITLKSGVNFLAKLDVKASGEIADFLSKIGVSQIKLPLNGSLDPAVFNKDTSSVKNKILDNLDIKANLPDLSIPGLPGIITIKHGSFAIKGKKVGAKREIDVGVSGEMDVKLGSKEIDFTFDIAAAKPAGATDLIIHANSDKKVTVPFFKPLELDKMIFRANLARGTWYLNINAKSKLNNKPIDLDFIKIGKGAPSLYITTKLTLADLAPISVPGLSDIELGRISLSPDKVEMFGKIKGMPVEMVLFKRGAGNKTHVGISFIEFDIGKIIPGASSTPLKDINFVYPAMVWVPKGAAETGVVVTTMPYAVSNALNRQGSPKQDLKEGLNLFAKAKLSGGIADMLKKVGINKTQFPLKGGLSPAVFKKGGGAEIKNAILDALDIKINLPDLAIPGLPGSISIKQGHFAIKGKKSAQGVREIDVGVQGELIAKLGNSNVDFDFDIELIKKAGQPTEISISGETEPGTTATLSMVETITLDDMSFSAKKKGGAKWDWQIDATSKLHNKPVTLIYAHDSAKGSYLDVITRMTLAEAVGQPGLPGLDEVEMDWMKIWKNKMIMEMKIKGVKTDVEVFKPQGASKYNVALLTGDFSPDKFIPDTSNTPLKDVTFKKLGFLYNPGAARPEASLPFDIGAGAKDTSGQIQLKKGLNVFGHMDVHPAGHMKEFLDKAGVSDLSLPLNGKFSKKAFSKDKGSIKQALLDALDITIKLPHPPSIEEYKDFITFNDGILKVKGKSLDGKSGIQVSLSGNVDLEVAGSKLALWADTTYDKSPNGDKELQLKAHTEKPWVHPFGANWITLDTLRVSIDKKKRADTARELEIHMTAKTDIGRHSRLDVVVDVDRLNGKTKYAWVELDGPVDMSEIPGVKDIPHAGKFSLNALKVSKHGVEAKTTLGGKKTNAYIFQNGGKDAAIEDDWNMALQQENFTITEIIPPLAATPFKYIKFTDAALLFSEGGIVGSLQDISIIAQDALADVYDEPNARVKIAKGLSLIAEFEKGKSGKMGEGIGKLGVGQEKVVVTGNFGGLFGGPIDINLNVALAEHQNPHNMPKWMKGVEGVETIFSMIATESGGQFDIEFGIAVDLLVKVHDALLTFEAKAALEFEDEKADIKVIAKLKADGGNTSDKKGWDKPFGIPGIALSGVGFDLGLDEDGAVHIAFTGGYSLGDETFTITADADLVPEALGAPQDIAFIGSASQIDMFFLEEMALNVLGKKLHLDIPQGVLPVFKKVKFAFVTPGAQDPDLDIYGEGFAMKGSLNWLDHELGSVNVSINPTDGINAKGKIDDINLGPLVLKDNMFDMKVPVKLRPPLIALPHLRVHSDLAFLGIKERFLIDFNKSGIKIDAHSQFGPDFAADFDLTLSGVNLDVKKPGFKNADFAMDGDFKLDIGKFIAGPAKADMNAIFYEMGAVFVKAEADVRHFRGKVDGLNARINAERAKVRRERAAAERPVQSAENRVNRLNGEVNNDWNHYHHCHGWGKAWCKAKWGIRARFAEGARWVAEEALRAVESLIAHFPIDLDPRVAILISEKDVAKAALTVALFAIEGADELGRLLKIIENKLLKGLESKAVANSININKASFKGDLKGVIERDTPVDLALDAELFGLRINENFAFKIKDIAYDLEQLGILGLFALEHLVETELGDISHALKNKFRAVVNRKIEAKQAAHKREMAKYGKDFTKYNNEARAMQARLLALAAAQLKEKLAENTSPLDTDGRSLTFSNEYLEVGHTGLCLTNEGGGVTQHPCGEEKKSQQEWQTSLIGTGHGVPDGYVSIRQGGEALVPEGSWMIEEKKFGEFSLPIEEFKGTGRLVMAGFKEKKEYFWKVLKHGDGWMQIANRATNHCLHFSDGDARPGKAKAEWAPCVGSANQVFRVANKVTPKYYKVNISLKNDGSDTCFNGDEYSVYSKNCNETTRYDYMIDIRGSVKFINTSSGKCLQPGTYEKNAWLVDKTCSQLDYQWWQPVQVQGGWMLKNAQTGLCATIYPGENPGLEPCLSQTESVITPVKDSESGVKLVEVHGKALPGGVQFDAAYTIQERIPEYTKEKHAQEIAKINELKNNTRTFEKYTHPERSPSCNASLNYFMQTYRGAPFWRGWALTDYYITLASPRCRVKHVLDRQAAIWIHSDDFMIKQLQNKLRRNARPAPEPKWYVCLADAPNGARMPGVVRNRRCDYTYQGYPHSSDNYHLVWSARGVEWKHGGGGHIPDLALPLGDNRWPGYNETAYSCRTMVNDKTRIGWTSDGRICWYNHNNIYAGARNFEVLSRKPEAAYKLDLTN